MRTTIIAFVCIAATSCTNNSTLRTDLSAPAISSEQTEAAMLNVLAEAMDHRDTWNSRQKSASKIIFRTPTDDTEVRRYLAAGFGLTDLYCDKFFRETNASMRRRKFGRTVTNDVGTAIGSILGLIETVPKGVISGATAITGGLDSTWRNYDDSFVVAPELQNVRSLVLAAQDEYRRSTYDKDALPKDFMTARSAIVRYAGLCSFLGMQSLLTQSIDQQRKKLVEAARPTPTPTQTNPAAPAPPVKAAAPPAAVEPAAAPVAEAPAEAPAASVGVIPPA